MFGNLNRYDSKSSRLVCDADRQLTGTQAVLQVREPRGNRAARRSRRDVPGEYRRQTLLRDIPSLTAYSTRLHALQVRNDRSEYDMMAPMAEDARIEDVLEQWNENCRRALSLRA